MIRSCEDIKTLDDFYEFAKSCNNADELGLRETVNMIRWNDIYIICPELFVILERKGVGK